jgi:hypothetical protein
MERSDKIFVRKPNEFFRKILRYANDYQNNRKVYENIHSFIKLIYLDSERCKLIHDGEFELLEATRKKLVEGGNTVSDTYLFEAASASES